MEVDVDVDVGEGVDDDAVALAAGAGRAGCVCRYGADLLTARAGIWLPLRRVVDLDLGAGLVGSRRCELKDRDVDRDSPL